MFAGEQERGVQVLKQDAKAVITDFDSSKEYSFKVYTVSGSQLSKPLLGTYKGNQRVESFKCIVLFIIIV